MTTLRGDRQKIGSLFEVGRSTREAGKVSELIYRFVEKECQVFLLSLKAHFVPVRGGCAWIYPRLALAAADSAALANASAISLKMPPLAPSE